MSRAAFNKFFENLDDNEQKKILKLAADYGIDLDAPEWIPFAVAHGTILTAHVLMAKIPDLTNKAGQELISQINELKNHLNTAKELHDDELKLTATKTLNSVSDQVAKQIANSVEKQTSINHLKTIIWTILASIPVIMFLLTIGYFSHPVLDKINDGLTNEQHEWLILYDTPTGKLLHEIAQQNNLISAYKKSCNIPKYDYYNRRVCELLIYIDGQERDKQGRRIDEFLWKYREAIFFCIGVLATFSMIGLILFISWLIEKRRYW